ncbi:alkaline phosphatase family protein [Ignisphaera sp. 4213-co]|uniref:Alkaline phosphatase family protein n=1 Tax=Ignisphaera cupida TaxID=3050454 RepID=A0ABD4Z552_9CREN|nr:alkaline phosphatase family protein [Ignisphaera sp. 4213-co]MDK6028020.1 alkaline phosphatase family protein [Ignisphaera sp. 4213-co]
MIIIVLDGVADSLKYRPTSLELAKTQGLNELARISIGGCFYPIDDETAPESDAAVFSILGYNPKEINVGRGLLEALGVGIELLEGSEVAFRANFATIDAKTLKIIDRRVGRSLTSAEAKELAKSLNNLNLGIYGGYAKVYSTVGHRAVVVIGSKEKRLSANVSNTDPAYGRVGRVSIALEKFEPFVAKCKPLDNSEEAKITCELVDEFTKKVIEILDSHPINVKRAEKSLPKANALLLRDAEDRYPNIKSISTIYGKSFGIVAEMPVEKGIGKLLGMKAVEVSPPSGSIEKDLKERLEATLKLLNEVDVVYVHLKGPDEPGHDGNKQRKVSSIEAIDRYYILPLIESIDLNKIAIVVTADHATPPEFKAHTSDPVPLIVASKALKRTDGLNRFTEHECCSKGSLGIIPHGYLVLKKIFELLNQ